MVNQFSIWHFTKRGKSSCGLVFIVQVVVRTEKWIHFNQIAFVTYVYFAEVKNFCGIKIIVLKNKPENRFLPLLNEALCLLNL